jgi:DNA polymerase-3 subunit gamma/tau
MASESLYRKWRSQTFSDMVGQEAIIQTLKNTLSSGKLAHAYLFTGPRGTGKTSTARLLAKTINCLNPQNGEPCNVCAQCREITNGSSFNVMEIDAASNRGIDSIRELREKVMMPPTTGKYKVYILDEAHMLTTEAFNALLKTLEEPPPHAIFVMATTEVHKLLPTVLSRCQRFDFKRFTLRQLVDRLHYVAQQEHIEMQPGSVELIARAASGGMRDALSLLDQAIAYAGNVISLEQVQSMLGVADPRAIQKFITHIADLDSCAGLHLINELSEAGADLRQINTQVAEYWRAMMLGKAGAHIAEILDNTDDEIKEIMELTKRFTLTELTECARVFAQNDLLQKSLATPQLGLELAFLNCIEIHSRAQDGPAQPANNYAPRQGTPTGNVYGTAASAVPRNTQSPQPTAVPRPPIAQESAEDSINGHGPADDITITQSPAFSAAQQTPPTQTPSLQQQPPTQPATPTPVRPAPARQPQSGGTIDWQSINLNGMGLGSTTTPQNLSISQNGISATEGNAGAVQGDPPTLMIEDVKEKWELVRRRVRTRKDGAKISALLGGYTIMGVEGTSTQPIVVCQAHADFHYKTLQNDDYHDVIRWALKVTLETECNIRLLAPNVNYNPPPFSGPRPVRPGPGPINPGGSDGLLGPSGAHPNGPGPVTPLNNAAVPQTPRDSVSMPQNPQLSVPVTPTVPHTPTPVAAPVLVQPNVQTASSIQPASAAALPVTSGNLWDQGSIQQVHPAPLARNVAMRENTSKRTETVPGSGTRRETIEKQARSNPVVLEAVRLFKAEIKEIQPK